MPLNIGFIQTASGVTDLCINVYLENLNNSRMIHFEAEMCFVEETSFSKVRGIADPAQVLQTGPIQPVQVKKNCSHSMFRNDLKESHNKWGDHECRSLECNAK